MKKALKVGLLLALALSGPWPQAAMSQSNDQLPRGQLVEKLICAHDATQSYALYLPSNYSSSRSWPVLYAFDPGARGEVPVERFREAAERYGWIVVGSNNSRNGPMQPSAKAFEAIWQDTHERFALDEARAYTVGLSGGARVATMLAHLCGGCITGVIACGAGFPIGLAPSPAMHFTFFATVGVDDFNFPEVRELEPGLTNAGIPHWTEVFAGRHEWPPAAVAIKAVEWMELQNARKSKRQRDDKLLDSIWQLRSQQAQALEDAKQPFEAYQAYTGLVEVFKGLRDTSELEKRINQLRDSRTVKDAVRDERQQIRKQRDLENQVNSLIAERDTNPDTFAADGRLRGLLANLDKSSQATADGSERRVARRVLSGLFIGLFEQAMNLLDVEKRYSAAVQRLELATEVAADRPGAWFYLACAYNLNGEKKKALQALKTAIAKGYADLASITNNAALNSLHSDPQYQQMIEALQNHAR
jgi:predicted esterase